MSTQRTATVVVARSAQDDKSNTSRQWLEEIVKLASQSPGFLRSHIQAPGPQHPNEWVVVYEFNDRANLDTWLSSSARSNMVSREPELFIGAPREQIIVSENLQNSVTAVASFKLATFDPDQPRGAFDAASAEAAFDDEYERLTTVVARFDGFLRCDLLPAEPGVQEETIIVFSFRDRPSLDSWLESAERQQALAALRPLIVEDRTLNIVDGFAGWFAQPGDAPVKTWKSALLILIALYPTALVVGFVRDLIFSDLSGPVATLIANAGGVAILSWLIMPGLTARFAQWLRR